MRLATDGMAHNARRQQRREPAVEAYQTAIRIHPQAAAYYWFQLGRTWEEFNRDRDAIRAYEQAVSLEPKTFESAANKQIDRLRKKGVTCWLNPVSPPAGGR